MRAVVVGAGIAGLSAAHALKRCALRDGRPLELLVLEAASRPGGHVGSVREDGFLVETGPNGFLLGEPATEQLIEDLDLSTSLVPARAISRRRYLLRGARLHQLPVEPLGWLTTGALTLRGRLRLAAEPWIRPKLNGSGEETVFEFAARRFGREAAVTLADAVVAGTSGGDAETLSMPAAFPAVVEMERRHGSLVRAVIARRRAGLPAPILRSFANGMATLVEALAASLGPALRVGDPVTAVERVEGAWRLRRGNGEAMLADRVILAVAPHIVASLLAGRDERLGAELRAIPSASLAVAVFAWPTADLARPLNGYGYLVPRSEGLETLGVVWESSLFPGRAPEGWALVRVMLGGARSPGTTLRAEPELLALAERELAPVIGARRPPARAWVHRWPEAIAQYGRGHGERLGRIRRFLAAETGLTLCGAGFDGVSFNAAVASGAAAAERSWSA